MTAGQEGRHVSALSAGILKTLPLVFGYVPIGLTFGVLAQKAGLSAFNALMMSLLVYAGSSQLVAAGLFAAGAPAASIILTTFVVNLRHLLLSAAIAPFLESWRRRELAAFAYQLTDETFALHAARFQSGVPSKTEVFAINTTAQMSWLMGTSLGVVLGQIITDVEAFGLDYVLPALFIALIAVQIEETKQIGIALCTGALSLTLRMLGLGQWHVIIATVAGASLGVVTKLWTSEKSS